jgi:hypothetical protein
MSRFELQFDRQWIPELARCYDYAGERDFIKSVAEPARTRGWLTPDEFIQLVAWKTQSRSLPLFLKNDRRQMVEASRAACSPSTPEAERTRVLLQLEGVGFPVASVVLHFVASAPYPILDRRALESLGYVSQRTTYTEHFWQEYVATCRLLATQSQVSMRDLDRALWAWPGLPDRDRYRLHLR